MDLITVIVPVYNVEKYLPKCIESIINQSYKHIEIILVDDGATDNSGKICDEYATKDSRIKVIHKKNGGLSDARNKGIDASNGQYIVFIDSDDYVQEDMIIKLYENLVENDADISICGLSYVDEEGHCIDSLNGNSPLKKEVLTSHGALTKLTECGGVYFVYACGKLYRKQIFNDIRFPYGKLHEDVFVAHLVYDECTRVSCIEEELYYYVQRKGSIMSTLSAARRLYSVEAMIERLFFFFENNMKKLAIKQFPLVVNMLSSVSENDDYSKKENMTRFRILRKRLKYLYFKNMLSIIRYSNIKSFFKITIFLVSRGLYDFICGLLKKRVKNQEMNVIGQE